MRYKKAWNDGMMIHFGFWILEFARLPRPSASPARLEGGPERSRPSSAVVRYGGWNGGQALQWQAGAIQN